MSKKESVSYKFHWEVYKLLNDNLEFESDNPSDYQIHWERKGRFSNFFIRVKDKYPNFDWREYKRLNKDLEKILDNDQISYECHWLLKGIHEGRIYSETMYNNINKFSSKEKNKIENNSIVNNSIVNNTNKLETINSVKVIAFVFPRKEEFEWRLLKKIPRKINSEFIKQPHDDIGYYEMLNIKHRKFMGILSSLYNVYGFCYMDYWSIETLEKNKVLEQMLIDGEPNKPFMICWDNENIKKYDNVDIHFNYLIRFFTHKNYMRIHNKPIFIIHVFDETIKKYVEILDNLVKSKGIDGLYIMSLMTNLENNQNINGVVEYYPKLSINLNKKDIILETGSSIFLDEYDENLYLSKNIDVKQLIQEHKINNGYEHYVSLDIREKEYRTRKYYSYDSEVTYEKIIETPRINNVQHKGIYVGWNDTPKKINNFRQFSNYPHMFKYMTLESFKNAFYKIFEKTINDPNPILENNFIFINSWNNWHEQSILEPSDIDSYDYIKVVGEITNLFYEKKNTIFHISNSSNNIEKIYIDNIKNIYDNYNHIISTNIDINKLQNDVKLVHIHSIQDITHIISIIPFLKNRNIRVVLTIHEINSIFEDKEYPNLILKKNVEYLNSFENLLNMCNNVIFSCKFIYDLFYNKLNINNKCIAPFLDIKYIHDCIWIPNITNRINLVLFIDFISENDLLLLNYLLNYFSKYKNISVNYSIYSNNNLNIKNFKVEKYELTSLIEKIHGESIHGIMYISNMLQVYDYTLLRVVNSGVPIFYKNIGFYKDFLVNYEKYIGFLDENINIKFVEFLNYIINNKETYQYKKIFNNIQPNRSFIENYIY